MGGLHRFKSNKENSVSFPVLVIKINKEGRKGEREWGRDGGKHAQRSQLPWWLALWTGQEWKHSDQQPEGSRLHSHVSYDHMTGLCLLQWNLQRRLQEWENSQITSGGVLWVPSKLPNLWPAETLNRCFSLELAIPGGGGGNVAQEQQPQHCVRVWTVQILERFHGPPHSIC